MKIMETANQNELNSAKRMANMKLSRDLTCSGNDLQMVPCASSLGAQVRSFKRASLYRDRGDVQPHSARDEIRSRSVTMISCFSLAPPQSLESSWLFCSLLPYRLLRHGRWPQKRAGHAVPILTSQGRRQALRVLIADTILLTDIRIRARSVFIVAARRA